MHPMWRPNCTSAHEASSAGKQNPLHSYPLSNIRVEKINSEGGGEREWRGGSLKPVVSVRKWWSNSLKAYSPFECFVHCISIKDCYIHCGGKRPNIAQTLSVSINDSRFRRPSFADTFQRPPPPSPAPIETPLPTLPSTKLKKDIKPRVRINLNVGRTLQ